MGTVLLTWEMGRGLGHLVPLSPIATGLARRGHHVYLAARDLSRVHIALDRNLVTCIQAPLYLRPGGEAIAPAMTFAHILYNNGFGAADQLQALADAWITLYRWVKPDLILFDHSPTALLASRASRASKALVGLGFFCPPDADPLPNLRTWLKPDPECLRQGEQPVLENMNQVLHALGEPPLDRITQMYAQVDVNFLATFPELDHYPDRKGGKYSGVWTSTRGIPPQWPNAAGPKVYAYLKSFPHIADFLSLLSGLRICTLIYADGIERAIQQRFTSDAVRFENDPLDLGLVARQCDLAIMNGNHGTAIAMLLAGKPTFQLPITLEQVIFSAAIGRLGAGLDAAHLPPRDVVGRLQTMLASPTPFIQGAARFAQRYASFNAQAEVDKMLDRFEELLNRAH